MNASVLRSIKSFWMAVVTMAAAYTIAAAPPEARASESAVKVQGYSLNFAAERSADPLPAAQMVAMREPEVRPVSQSLAHAPQALAADLGKVMSSSSLRESPTAQRQSSDEGQDLKVYPVLLALIGVLAMLASRRQMAP